MGQGQKSNKLLVPEASRAMYQFKYEMANEVGIQNQIQGDYWGYISSRDCGAVGGAMVRRMIQAYQQNLVSQSPQASPTTTTLR
ncbi:MAG TPA: alpha/beta-type small acid-soluble spore protein [Syntrophomonadaceae bacterium]|nr:alpha/beta-type small acid-soluble spore protein [Syntrophomonadaceae bacterium]